jgi:hypothetical protein
MTAYLFDGRQGRSVDDWAESLRGLDENQVIWLDLMDASEGEVKEVLDSLELGGCRGVEARRSGGEAEDRAARGPPARDSRCRL